MKFIKSNMKDRIIVILIFGIILLSNILLCQTNDAGKILIQNFNLLNGEKIFFTKHKVVSGIVLGDIYSMDPNGSSVQQLTNFSNNLSITERPEISSDGTKLAFISNHEEWKSSNYADAFIADLNTGIISRVTGYEKTTPINVTGTVNVKVNDPKGYALTPSAIRISYSGCANFITGNSAALTVPANEDIWIKAIVARGKGDIKVVNVPSGGNTSVQLDLSAGTITAESCSPSPNGNYLAVSRDSETVDFPWYKNLIWDTKTKLPITEAGGLKLGGDKHPAYSPDGSMLAICTGELFSNSLAVLSTSNITATPTILVEGQRILTKEFCGDPAWSPNSSEIVFVYTSMNANAEFQANLFKIPVNGGNPEQLTFYSGNEIVSRPSYSPDGNRIAFNLLKSKNTTFSLNDLIFYTFTSDIKIVHSNGGTPISISSDGNSIDPSWGIVNTTVRVEEENAELLDEFRLSQNYPNPFNPTTTIQYSIPVVDAKFASTTNVGSENIQSVQLKVYDVLGKEVATLVNKEQASGNYQVQFDASSFSSGMYFYKLSGYGYTSVKKMLLLK